MKRCSLSYWYVTHTDRLTHWGIRVSSPPLKPNSWACSTAIKSSSPELTRITGHDSDTTANGLFQNSKKDSTCFHATKLISQLNAVATAATARQMSVGVFFNQQLLRGAKMFTRDLDDQLSSVVENQRHLRLTALLFRRLSLFIHLVVWFHLICTAKLEAVAEQ